MPNDTEKTPAEVGAELGRQVGEVVGAAAGEAVSRIADEASERIKQEAHERVAGIGERARGAFGRVKEIASGGFRQIYDRSPALSEGVDRVRELPDRYPRQTLRAAFFFGLFLGFRAYGRRHRHA